MSTLRGARVGDEVVVDSLHLGEPPRKGEILEIRAEPEPEHYVVRWDDNGHETIFFPGSTSHVVHPPGRPHR
jgi:hypothetical protein